jgi:acyl-CoA thioester hydrolase
VNGREHVSRFPVRVRYADVDPMGIVYYANYLRWFEVGRTEFLRELGTSYREVEESGVFYPVTETHVKYAAPARYDETIVIVTTLAYVKRASLRFDYEIDGEDGSLHATGFSVHAAVDRAGKIVRISDELLGLFGGPGGRA